MSSYSEFLARKSQLGENAGFDPVFMPDFLFDFQRAIVEWAVRKGRAAIFADCGLGKTPCELVWAENVTRHTGGGRVLILTPLAVGVQTVKEGEKFGIECARSRDGRLGTARIVVSNYEQLHQFTAADFSGVACDESSILKHFSGHTQKAVTRFMAKIPYRLLLTATAAPNDYIELGTASEALGELGYTDMLSRFFKQGDKAKYRQDEVRLTSHFAEPLNGNNGAGNHFAKLAFRVAQQLGQWRLKPHAEIPFWRWVASWARACRKPSDLGFADGPFILPPLNESVEVVHARRPPDGMLFTLPAFGLGEEREERKRTLAERCERAAELVRHNEPAIVWCHWNTEGNLLEKLIPDAVQVAGADSDNVKEDRLLAFQSGQMRVLITKPKIAGFGLNMQHCAHVVTFVSHSYESYYQAVRRCWRFGQTRPVRVDVIATEGEQRVAANMERKAQMAAVMFDRLVTHMQEAVTQRKDTHEQAMEVPRWL